MTNIDFTQVMKDKTAYFSYQEIEKMLKYCYDNGKIRDYVLILTLYRTGRRITEIVGEKPYTHKVGLRPIDIREDHLVEFDILKKNPIKSKTKSGNKMNKEKLLLLRLNKFPKRVLKPVDDVLFSVLVDFVNYNQIKPYDRLFPITRQRANDIVKHISSKCDIYRNKFKIHCHMFRHTFPITILKQNPNNAAVLRQVQDLLEHSSINVTMNTYAQFTQEDKKETLNKTFDDD